MLSLRSASSLLATTSGSLVHDLAKLTGVAASRAYHKNVSVGGSFCGAVGPWQSATDGW